MTDEQNGPEHEPTEVEELVADQYEEDAYGPVGGEDEEQIGFVVPERDDEPEYPEPPLDQVVPFDLREVKPTEFDPGEKDPNASRLRDEEGNLLPEFDARYREDFDGLMFLGALSTTFGWLGHKFTIRTLTVDEQLLVALLTKAYAESMGQPLAYRTAIAALSVQRIDGKDLPVPLGPEMDSTAYAEARFNYAKSRWFQFTVDAIYNKYLDLDEQTKKVVDALGKASASSR